MDAKERNSARNQLWVRLWDAWNSIDYHLGELEAANNDLNRGLNELGVLPKEDWPKEKSGK